MKVLEKIDQLLDEERQVLLKGEFQKLEAISTSKLDLLEQVSATSKWADRRKIEKILLKSDRNDQLIVAAMRGIKSAITHIKEASENSFMSYSKDGERCSLSKEMTIRQKV